MDHSTGLPAPPARRRRSRVITAALGVVLTGRAAWSGDVSPAAVRQALDAILACERPEGGWTYVCNPSSGPYGAVTWPLVRARAVAEPLGLADWDIVVLRSPGTPAAGLALLDGWQRTHDPRYLAAAQRTGDLLLALQLRSGGWFSEVPVHGTTPTIWFRAIAHWATLDDDVTPGVIRFLLALFEQTGDQRYRGAAVRGLELLLAAQLPSGAWPLTWRPGWARALVPSFEDLASTNDAATAGPITALIAGTRVLGRSDLLAAARRGGDWLARAQGAEPQAAWAQQLDDEDRPAPGRRFELAGFASWESREMVDALLALADATGDVTFCAPVPKALDWFARSALGPGCWARLYTPGSNAPLYVGADGRPVATPAEARRPYRWTGEYGIPGLLAAFGLDERGAPRDPSLGPPPPRRIPGDAGRCAGDHGSGRRSSGPRARIARATALLGTGAPATATCAAIVGRTFTALPPH
ncbi:MAG TPA: pectate lyase [Candidatus Binatus sp.]|nr:pectate lyase [Candidatus Binatus sp.]